MAIAIAGEIRILGASPTIRGMAQAAPRQVCLRIANTPDVPFCAAGRMATAVVLARRSVPTELAAERGSACSSAGEGSLPCLLQLPAYYRTRH